MINKPLSTKDLKIIFTEMFRIVGEKYTQKYTAQPKWFEKHQWSLAEQEDFKKWLAKFFREKGYCWKSYKHRGKDHGEYEAGKFIFEYGWKTNYD